ncbi:MAG TPA: Gfo/Idh/MocA family oxidoreductase, partial [Gemmatimonadaceae bacterium]|nr:Gfo/Idh/MocA family oxidoreductase [Gemmatimonadaceae bacterium]
MPGLRSIPGVEVVGICGAHADRAADAASRLEIPHAVTSVDALLDLGVDAVTLALPPAENARGARLAIDRRVAVLCEKPLAQDPDVARELAARAFEITNAVDFQFAELDAFRRLHDVISSHALGDIRQIRVRWFMESSARRLGRWSWKRDRALGGGVMTLLGTHLLYLLEWLCGPIEALDGVSRVLAAAPDVPRGRVEADDTLDARFTFRSGATGEASMSNAISESHEQRWEIDFEHGHALLMNATSDHMRGFSLRIDDRNAIATFEDEDAPAVDGRLAPFARLATRFVEHARAGRATRPDFTSAVRVAQLAALVRP